MCNIPEEFLYPSNNKDFMTRNILDIFNYFFLFFDKLIKIVPRIGPKEDAKSLISLRVVDGARLSSNIEFQRIVLAIEIFVPLTQWKMKGTNLRPFSIMGEIQKSLNGKVIDGIGKLRGGDFEINFLTDEMSCYEITFDLTAYD